jgi:uncharacterized membrane protein
MQAVLIIQAVLLVAIAAAMWFLPLAVAPSIAFGVRIPPERRTDAAVLAATRGYRLGIGVSALICLALLFLIQWPPVLLSASVLIFLILFLVDFLVARSRVLRAKEAGHWFSGTPEGAAAATSPDSGQGAFPWSYLLPALILIVLTVIVGIIRFPALPDRIPAHFTLTGAVNRYTTKSWGSVLFPVWTQLFVTGLITVLSFVTWRSPRQLDPARPETSLQRSWQFRRRLIRLLLLLSAAVDLTLLLAGLLTWNVLTPGPATLAMLLAIPLLAAAVLVVVSFRMGQEGVRIPAQEPAATGLIARDDDRLWKAGLVYWNPKDPALIVPKRFGIGYTFNFGHWLAWAVLLALILTPVVITHLAHG